MSSSNERVTENLVRAEFRKRGYYETDDIRVEEQKSDIEAVAKLLRSASKSCGGGKGSPEFIVSSPTNPDFLLIVECKGNSKDHVSPDVDTLFATTAGKSVDEDYVKRCQRFGVDGVLHYARFLSREFNVIAVAISGDKLQSSRISTYLHTKGTSTAKELTNKGSTRIEAIISWSDYIEHATFDPSVQRMRFEQLMAFSRDLHEFMRDHAKLTESEKPLLVSGTLIALRNTAFSLSYSAHTPEDLQKEWLRVIQKEIFKARIPRAKKANMTQPYSSIAVHPELGKRTRAYPRGILHELITRLNEKVWPFISVYHDFDVVGRFYGEFLKYTGGDKKSLGIVLTPRHITELFALLANVNKDSVVLDLCAGTGGFLVSAMHQMMKSATTETQKRRIKQNGLIGVEQQPNMFALAASNMILRGDGKANLFQGSCFDKSVVDAIRKHKCNVGMLNPPYSQTDAEQHELRFVKQMLDCLGKGGTGIAVIPMSSAISPHPVRRELLATHTLEAVMSMPDELFYPVGVITCIMVFTSHVPHATSNRKTWFGYWKNDRFVKTKHLGRSDIDHTWPSVRDRWVEAYRNREVHSGESVIQRVTDGDEWCAEAYMETDYSTVSPTEFDRVVRNYAMFKLQTSTLLDGTARPPLQPNKWRAFTIHDLFEVRKGKRLTKAAHRAGTVPFVGAIDNNNGVTAHISQEALHTGNTLTVNYNGAGVAEAFYQPVPFRCSDDVNVLYPKFQMDSALALFIAAIIRREKYRFNYGRKWHLERMREAEIKLPSKGTAPDWAFMRNYITSLPLGSQI